MYQTIRISSCVSVQGECVEVLNDGQVVIRVGQAEYRGRPIERRANGQPAGGFAAPNRHMQSQAV